MTKAGLASEFHDDDAAENVENRINNAVEYSQDIFFWLTRTSSLGICCSGNTLSTH